MNASLLLRTLPATALLALPLACGGGGGGGDTPTAASATQVAQAVLVASASLSGASAATATSAGAVTTTSVASTSVRTSAMGMGPGSLDLPATSCDAAGTMDMHAHWSAAEPTTGCVEGLEATLGFSQCADTAGEPMEGTLGMTISGSTCDPTLITMDFSRTTVTTPDGILSGDFTLGMSGMAFAGNPANLDITEATLTLDGPMQMAGSGFGTVAMAMDGLAFHWNDTAHTGDLNGTLTVRCNGHAFPMTLATAADDLTLDEDGNISGGQMTVTAEGTAHQVTFNSDGSIDVTPAGGTALHMDGPASSSFCDLP